MGVNLATYADALACVGALALALLLALAGGRTAPARILAALMLAMAVNTLSAPLHLVPGLADERAVAYNLRLWSVASSVAIPGLYLAFAASAIRAPLLRPLRSKAARNVLLGLALVAVPAVLLANRWVLPHEVTHDGHPMWEERPSLFFATLAAGLVAFALPLLAALQAYRSAPRESPGRAAARRYLTAFVVFDAVGVGIVLNAGLGGMLAAGGSDVGASAWRVVDVNYAILSVAFVVALFLIARAVLRDQLVEFDLRVKWALARATLGAIFVAVFLVIAAVTEQYLERYGVLLGGVAVGVLLFLLRPLERVAERLADAAMPDVRDTSEYRTVRRREVYRAAVEGALQDGSIDEREREVLARVADQLGLSATETLRIEREALARPADALPAAA